MPQKLAGSRILPPVSVPMAPGEMRAATAAAEPPLEPPGTLERSQGFFTGPKLEFSLLAPMANSSRFVLPTITAPAASSFSTTVDEYVGIKLARILEAAVVLTPFVRRRSLTEIGTPASGPGSFLEAAI